MVDLIEKNLIVLQHLCRRYRVKRLEAFGSAVSSERFNPTRSDLDFLVEFLPLQSGEYADTYFGLLDALHDTFGCHVDLVMTRAIKNPYFLESIDKCRRVLYAA
jgi:hypothetical protein